MTILNERIDRNKEERNKLSINTNRKGEKKEKSERKTDRG